MDAPNGSDPHERSGSPRRPSAEGRSGPAGGGGSRRLSFWHRNRVILRPWMIFIVIYGMLLAAFRYWPATVVDRILTDFTARTTASTLSFLGQNGRTDGVLVSSSIFSVRIVSECTAVFPIMLFVSAVAACPVPWRRKLLGVALGMPALTVINLFRLVSLFYIGHWFPSSFKAAHLLVWQSLIIFFTVLLWLFWLIWAGRLVPRHES